MTADLYLFCPVCGQDRPAELPLCDDASEDERVCVDCSAALFVDPVVVSALVAVSAA
jgi:hypothetical protein